MTIQRQYSLPNCKLVLEGWGNESESSGGVGLIETRPALTILVNAECHFSGHNASVSGGREFLESLVHSVSQYAQQVLSGVSHAERRNSPHPLVQLQPLSPHVHRLIVRQSPADNSADHGATVAHDGASNGSSDSIVQLDLSTVQLFDLVEAIDQMVADAQTLPDLSVNLSSIPKRQTAPQKPATERVVPAAVGIAGLAAAAIALFFIPPPEFRPAEQEPTAEEQVLDAGEDITADGEPIETDPVDVDAETDAVSDPESDLDSDADPESSSGSSANGATSGRAALDDLPREEELEELFTQSSPVSDRDTLEAVTTDLRDRLDEAWDDEATFDEPLEYRVGLSESGDIVGFLYPGDNPDLAIELVDELPLMDLLVPPEDPDALRGDTIAQFKVVFQPSGVIEVSPWYGWPEE